MNNLRCQISVFTGTVLAVGMVVGSGLFGLPGLALQISSPQIAAIAWLTCAILCFPLLCIFSVLGTRYASAGGLSRYAEAALGRPGEYAVAAVLCGTLPLVLPAQAMIGASYALVVFGIDRTMLLPLSIAFLVGPICINLSGVRAAALVNTVSLVMITATVLLLGAMHTSDLRSGVELWISPHWADIDLRRLWKAVALVFWAFLGWENVSFGLEEFKDPKTSISRAYFLSFLVVIGLYFILAATVNGASIGTSRVNTTEGLAHLVSPDRRMALFVVTLVVILATANAWIFGASRLYYAAARSGLLPPLFAELDKRGVPRNALLLLTACFFGVLLAVAFFHVHLTVLVLLANQNFLVLYLVCIYCFFKIARGYQRWILTPAALASCCFMLGGFGYTLIYSVALLGVGISCERSRNRSRAWTIPAKASAGENGSPRLEGASRQNARDNS
ncbi:amino acid efflux transporter [Paraburkholderia sp. RAU2J]|uniref:APC family permease n=1 Tax=Paraburkholderia sp. RAU2J TaxID=1938810 RepID=UPI000EB36C40|nr:APC family permease [Paraburkholderia sp. RAU2J]RKT10743.1 amino acid efflux transporter [Paraburkholderia sp. RAU2J]